MWLHVAINEMTRPLGERFQARWHPHPHPQPGYPQPEGGPGLQAASKTIRFIGLILGEHEGESPAIHQDIPKGRDHLPA